jgi:hypothetical protein
VRKGKALRHLFIAYAREDREFVAALEAQLNVEGLEVWKDESSIEAGREWRASIDEAVDGSGAVIVVLSPSSARSRFVTYEWARALGAGIRVVPVLIADSDHHPCLEALQHVDFRERRPWGRLVAALKGAAPEPDETPAVVRNAMAGLEDPEPGRQLAAVDQLGDLNHPAARAALIGALAHPNPDVEGQAALVLGKSDSEEAVDALVRECERTESYQCFRVLWALSGRPRPRRAREALRRFLDSDKKWLRSAAVRSLGHSSDPDDLAALARALADPSRTVRGTAVRALREAGEAAVPAILEVVTDESGPEAQYAGARALADMADERALPLLERLLRVEDRGTVSPITFVGYDHAERGGGGYMEVWQYAEAALKRIDTPAAQRVLQEWEESGGRSGS